MKRGFFLLLIAVSVFAQPAPEEFLGYKIGARFTPHHRILDYFDALAAASNLITHERFGQTWEGRPLSYAVITSPRNRAQLDAIRQRIAEINRPDITSPERAEEIARATPVITWLAFGVHGNESSSTEAAMMLARRLLDPDLASLREATVVILDPLQNPDGRERYIQWFQRATGMEPNPKPQGFEHFEPWPGGRYNHYLLDMNRDWSWQSQKETLARVALYQRWNPQVVVDFHEMSAESNYFFPPGAEPINANIDPATVEWLERFGRANADAFSARGWPFFVAESYDLFYPGYGDSWPTLRGAIGMTYEMAGSGRAGIALRREDESVLTLAERAERHFTTALVTVQTAANSRQDLIRHNYRVLRNQFDRPTVTYLVLPSSQNFDRFVELMTRQGLVVETLTAATRLRATPAAGGTAEVRNFPEGTAVISTRQPYGALVRTLLEKSPIIDERFLKEQREKIDADEEDDFNDVTAWSLPFAQNLEAFTTSDPVSSRPMTNAARSSRFQPGKFGYLIDGIDSQLYRAVGSLLRSGIRFRVSSASLTHGAKSFERGTVVIPRSNNGTNLDEQLRQIAESTGANIHAVDSGWSGGLALGSSKIEFVRDPRVAIAGGDGTDPASFGMIWYTLDVETRIPHSVIPLNRVGSIDLNEFRVIVLPDGSGYMTQLGKRGIERLQSWVRGGGTLVAVKGAAEFLREKDVEISKLEPWTAGDEKEGEAKDEKPPEDERYNDFRIPGAAFRTTMNQRSYLTFGLRQSPPVLLEGTTAVLPAVKRIDNIVTIADRDPLLSGFAWPESLERIKGSVYVAREPYGSGSVITFVDEPYYRLFWRGTLPLFLNAILYSPSFER